MAMEVPSTSSLLDYSDVPIDCGELIVPDSHARNHFWPSSLLDFMNLTTHDVSVPGQGMVILLLILRVRTRHVRDPDLALADQIGRDAVVRDEIHGDGVGEGRDHELDIDQSCVSIIMIW